MFALVPLVVEHMPGTRSCAAVWMLPIGTAGDPEGDAGEGESTVLAELILRGAGVRLGLNYPHPIIAHAEGRTRALAAYAAMRAEPA